MHAHLAPLWATGLALVMLGAACESGSAASSCSGPTLAATWAATSEEASAHAGTTMYGDPARAAAVTPGAQSGEPAFSPDGTRLAVGVGSNTGDGMAFSVVVVDVRTGRQHVIARPGSNTVAPAWSPDGRRIAYIGGVYPESQLRVVGADSRGDRILASESEPERQLLSPAWARNGRAVYFLNADVVAFGGGTAVWSVPAAGGSPRRVANVHPLDHRMVADRSGRTLLLSVGTDAPNQLLDPETGVVHRLRGAAAAFATWAGDDTILGYQDDRLAKFRLDGLQLRRTGTVAGFHSRSGASGWFGVSVRRCAA
jgi:dipeptidyl aminopeptidase/acylaminoacyl peptidase